MIRWLLRLPLMLAFGLLTFILSPILPAFREDRLGPTLNGNSMGVEPRLPRWLSLFDTTDNSLWGDRGWRTEHCPEYRSYFGMVRWLWRNGGHNFNYRVLGAPDNELWRYCTTRLPGEYYWKRSDGYWLYRRYFDLFAGRRLEVFLGWNLFGVVHGRCKLVCQIRIRSSAS